MAAYPGGLVFLVGLINDYDKAISLTDAEGKGTNISKLHSGLVGNPGAGSSFGLGMQIPWYDANHFNEHNIEITGNGIKYYIWQGEKSQIYASSPNPPASNTGQLIYDPNEGSNGPWFTITVNPDGKLSCSNVAASAEILAEIALICNPITAGYLTTIGVAVAALAAASTYINVKNEMQTWANDVLNAGFNNPPNWTSQLLGLMNEIDSTLLGLMGMKTITAGVYFSAADVIGISPSAGVAFEPSSNAYEGFLSVGVSAGVQEGITSGFQFGVWTLPINQLQGLSIGASVTVVVIGGISISINFSDSMALQGFTFSLEAGEDLSVSAFAGYTWTTLPFVPGS